MQWVETEPVKPLPRAAKYALLARAVEADPKDWSRHAQLGNLHHHDFRFADAIRAYEAAAALDPQAFDRWSQLADSYFQLGRHAEALDACDRGGAVHALGPDALSYRRGLTLYAMGDRDEAYRQFLRSYALRIPSRGALNPILQILSQREDGGALLDLLDGLEPPESNTVLYRAYRAIALSRLGRADEACALVDPERHVISVAFEPPSEFGGLEAFNRMLAEEILSDPPEAARGDGIQINYRARIHGQPAMTALVAFQRAAIADYIARRAELGMETALPDPPAAARLSAATNVLREQGTNGEHIHAAAYVSGVYYVALPESLKRAGDDRGALIVGNVSHTTGGHRACWGELRIKPQLGRMVLMPSHFFHDVIPPGTPEPRISVACDMRPVA